VSGTTYWNIGAGLEIGDVDKGEKTIQTMRTLEQNMVWLLK
jgi:hypothetical protein